MNAVINNTLEVLHKNVLTPLSYGNMRETVEKASLHAYTIFTKDPKYFFTGATFFMGWGTIGVICLNQALKKGSTAEKVGLFTAGCFAFLNIARWAYLLTNATEYLV